MDPKMKKYYKKAPQEDIDRLISFRAHHIPRSVMIDGIEWKYYCAGSGKKAILLLGGGIHFEIVWFPYIEALKDDYTVIVPIYPVVRSLDILLKGIKGVIDNEHIRTLHICGQSFGGMVAQAFAKRYPEMAQKLIIANSGTSSDAIPIKVRQKKIQSSRRIVKMMRFYPLKLMAGFLATSTYKSYFAKKYRKDFMFWRGLLLEIFKEQITKPIYGSTLLCMADFYESWNFRYDDFDNDDILIIESENDSAIKEDERLLLKATYPKAKVITFDDAGHVALIIKERGCIEAVKMFLNG